MAYLEPKKLTCPTCGFRSEVQVVVGVGPHSKSGDMPYRSFRKTGAFVEVVPDDGGRVTQLACPQDGTIVWTNISGKKA